MDFELLPPESKLPNLLDDNNILNLLDSKAYDAISPNALRVWCHFHVRYGLPTAELIEWLQKRIAGRKTIEIGSGTGDLAYHLGVQATDNRMQEWPDIKAYYRLIGQPPIKYPNFVQELDALEAVEQYKPDVVIGSWITQWIDPNLPAPPEGGNAWGIKEDKILATGCTYILIGNQKIHGSKKIMALPHEEFELPFLRSRASFPELNRVWIWND